MIRTATTARLLAASNALSARPPRRAKVRPIYGVIAGVVLLFIIIGVFVP